MSHYTHLTIEERESIIGSISTTVFGKQHFFSPIISMWLPEQETRIIATYVHDLGIPQSREICYHCHGGQCLRKGCGPMDKFVPKEKMSKKAQKKMATERRGTWAFSPITKKIDNKKVYNHKRLSRTRYDDGRETLFVYTDQDAFTTASGRLSGLKNCVALIRSFTWML